MPVSLHYNPCITQSIASRRVAVESAQKSLNTAAKGKIDPKDNPVSHAMAQEMTAEKTITAQASKNCAIGISALQFGVAVVSRMREQISTCMAAVTESNNTLFSPDQQSTLAKDLQSRVNDIDKDARTSFNSMPLFTGGQSTFSANAQVAGSAGGLHGANLGTNNWVAPTVTGTINPGGVSNVTVTGSGTTKTVSLSIGGQTFSGPMTTAMGTSLDINKETVATTDIVLTDTANTANKITLKAGTSPVSTTNADVNARLAALSQAVQAYIDPASFTPALSSDLNALGQVKMRIVSADESSAYGLTHLGNGKFSLFDYDANSFVGTAALDNGAVFFPAEGIRFSGVTTPADNSVKTVAFVSDSHKVPMRHVIQTGLGVSETISFGFSDLTSQALGLSFNLETQEGREAAQRILQGAHMTLVDEEAKLNTTIKQLEECVKIADVAEANYEAARSSQEDAPSDESVTAAAAQMSNARIATTMLRMSLQLSKLEEDFVSAAAA